MAILNERGHEVLDPTPIRVPVIFPRQEPLHLRIRRMIMEARREDEGGYESFADADDFAIDGDDDFSSPYEHDFDHFPDEPVVASPDPSGSPKPVQDGERLEKPSLASSKEKNGPEKADNS